MEALALTYGKSAQSLQLMQKMQTWCGIEYLMLRQHILFPRKTISNELICLVLIALQVILEGMGRAIHTNLHARFKCDALKVSVWTFFIFSCVFCLRRQKSKICQTRESINSA